MITLLYATNPELEGYLPHKELLACIKSLAKYAGMYYCVVNNGFNNLSYCLQYFCNNVGSDCGTAIIDILSNLVIPGRFNPELIPMFIPSIYGSCDLERTNFEDTSQPCDTDGDRIPDEVDPCPYIPLLEETEGLCFGSIEEDILNAGCTPDYTAINQLNDCMSSVYYNEPDIAPFTGGVVELTPNDPPSYPPSDLYNCKVTNIVNSINIPDHLGCYWWLKNPALVPGYLGGQYHLVPIYYNHHEYCENESYEDYEGQYDDYYSEFQDECKECDCTYKLPYAQARLEQMQALAACIPEEPPFLNECTTEKPRLFDAINEAVSRLETELQELEARCN